MSTFQPAAGGARADARAAISAPSTPRRGSQYAVLLRQVKQAGLLDRRTRYYLWRIAVTTALLSNATAASAQSTPRSVCCKELNGRWEENRRTKEMRCFGVSGNQYYACVAKRTGPGR